MSYSPPIKERGSKKARSTRAIDLARLKKRLLNSMSRESFRLLDVSYERLLSKTEGEALSRYIKVVNELEKKEKEEESNVSDSELAKTAQD